MKDEDFKTIIRQHSGCALIIAGSDSDRAHVEKITASLKNYGVPYEVRICSAHKSPHKLLDLIREYEQQEGRFLYIAVAGGTDALSGTLAFHSDNPVISCPPDAPNRSCLSNPPGSSNATVYNPSNVGRFVAQVFSGVNPEFRRRLRQSREQKIEQLEAKDRELRSSL